MEDVIKSVEKFKELKGLVIGDMMLDVYSFGHVERISPEAPVPIVKIEREEFRAGGASNVALNLKTLGAKVKLVGIVGNDNEGKTLLHILEENGIDVGDVMVQKKGKTIVKKRIISKGQQLMRIDFEDNMKLTKSYKEKIINLILKEGDEYNFIILEDYNKGLFTAQLYREIIKNTKSPIFIDPKYEHYQSMKNAFLLKPNFDEFKKASRLQRLRGNLLKAMESFRKKLNVKNLVVTKGEEGMYILGDDYAYHVPSLHRNVFDVTGAGDTVISLLALSMTSGLDPLRSSVLATIGAGIEITKLGAQPVGVEELLSEVKKHFERLLKEARPLKEQS